MIKVYSRPGRRPVRLCMSVLALVILSAWAGGFPARAQDMAIEPRFAAAGHFHEGMAPVLVADKWGFIDRAGKWIVEPRYDEVMTGSGGRFAIRTGKLWGFIGTRGTVAIEPQFDTVRPFSSGMAAFEKNGKWGYVGPTGNIMAEPRYEKAGDAFDGIFFVQDSEHGLARMDMTFTTQSLDHSFEGGWLELVEAGDISEGVVPLKAESGWLLADTKGDIFAGTFKTIGRFSDGLAAVSRDGKLWGFVGKDGKLVLQPRYENAREFVAGVAPVRIKGKWGYVDGNGKVVLQPTFDNAYPVREGWAIFRVGEKRGFLKSTESGAISEGIAAKYDDVYAPKEGLAPVKLGDQWGYLRLSTGAAHSVREIADLPAN